MLGRHKNPQDAIAAFSETGFRDDLKKFDKPTLFLHGADDQVVSIDVGGRASARPVPRATFIAYAGAPHGLTDAHRDGSMPTCWPSRAEKGSGTGRARDGECYRSSARRPQTKPIARPWRRERQH